MTPELLASSAEPTHVFPPALVPLVRERLSLKKGCLAELDDRELLHLVTTVFFAGLETYEGEHNPIGVAFIGRSAVDFVMTEGGSGGALPLYRWKILRFASPRPFVIRELVKLAVAGAGRRLYSAVGLLDDGALAIVGLAREGLNAGADPFAKVVSARPGCLSIHSGHDRLIEYERGAVLTLGEDDVFSAGPVHRALCTIARRAGVDDDVVPHYVHGVDVLVRELVAHGRGGILVISGDEHPAGAESATYRMTLDSSVAALLRLAWRISPDGAGEPRFRELLRNAFLTEVDRVVEELGRLTAIDGAVLLNRDLALIAFGVILPIGEQIVVVDATSGEGDRERAMDFGSRGTRHRAGATYAAEHPQSVVFVASEDGQVSCMLREAPDAPVRLWRMAAGIHAAR